jgi:NifU-like protein involved in Fe-S cluster formation
MDELLPGTAVDEVRRLAGAFEEFLAGATPSGGLPPELLVFAPLQSNPRRRECANLPWRVVAQMI